MLILREHNQYYYPGCHKEYLLRSVNSETVLKLSEPLCFDNNKEKICFDAKINFDNNGIDNVSLETSYFIGLQFIKEWNIPILIQPKLNTNNLRLNFYEMLSEALIEPENFNHLKGLMNIDFKGQWIEVPPNNQVELTPFLLIQFLMAVKQLVKRGLKKSYYTKEENLKGRVKGKILVSANVRQNVFKNRLTHTVCRYQEFGFDTQENRFIKYVLQFVYAHLSNYNYKGFRKQLKELLHFNLAAFHRVSDEKFKGYTNRETNPFFKIYNTVFDLGNQILKLISHSYEKSTKELYKYPPHWIDMSKLFELYVFKKLREKFPKPGEVKYHIKANYQELDFLIHSDEFKAVVDAKYKPRYSGGRPSKEDARQLSGYARLTSVYKKLDMENSSIIIPIYIIYPKGLEVIPFKEKTTEVIDNVRDENKKINILLDESDVHYVQSYKKMYLQEISLPNY